MSQTVQIENQYHKGRIAVQYISVKVNRDIVEEWRLVHYNRKQRRQLK